MDGNGNNLGDDQQTYTSKEGDVIPYKQLKSQNAKLIFLLIKRLMKVNVLAKIQSIIANLNVSNADIIVFLIKAIKITFLLSWKFN